MDAEIDLQKGPINFIMDYDKMISITDHNLSVHEKICAERYREIQSSLAVGEKRMTKIEYLLYGVMLMVLLGPGVAATFFKHFFGV